MPRTLLNGVGGSEIGSCPRRRPDRISKFSLRTRPSFHVSYERSFLARPCLHSIRPGQKYPGGKELMYVLVSPLWLDHGFTNLSSSILSSCMQPDDKCQGRLYPRTPLSSCALICLQSVHMFTPSTQKAFRETSSPIQTERIAKRTTIGHTILRERTRLPQRFSSCPELQSASVSGYPQGIVQKSNMGYSFRTSGM